MASGWSPGDLLYLSREFFRLDLAYGRWRVNAAMGSGMNVAVSADPVNHPAHYGGADNPYEAIKVIEAWKLDFHLGTVLKYIARCEKKGNPIEDLEKGLWYLQREINNRKARASHG